MEGAVSGIVECEGCGSVGLKADWWVNFAFMGVYSRPFLDRKQLVMTAFRPKVDVRNRETLTLKEANESHPGKDEPSPLLHQYA